MAIDEEDSDSCNCLAYSSFEIALMSIIRAFFFQPCPDRGKTYGFIVLAFIVEGPDEIYDILGQLHLHWFEMQRYGKPASADNLCKTCMASYSGIVTRSLGTAIL